MADEEKPGFLRSVRQRVAAGADALKAQATAVLNERASAIREAIGPQKTESEPQPDRPFGRDEGGEDVKRVVWTGHTVESPEGKTFFGAVGLTQGGYYRAAEVQAYGPDETWHWQPERHTAREDAIASAETLSVSRLRGADAPSPKKAAAQNARALEAQMARDLHELYPTREDQLRSYPPTTAPTDHEARRLHELYNELFPLTKEGMANVTPEQQANVNRALGDAQISDKIGGASDVNSKPLPNDPTPIEKAKDIGQDLHKSGVTMEQDK